MLLRQAYFAADIRQSNYTIRSSIVKYLFCSSVLYLLINSLVFTATKNNKPQFYISISAFAVSFLVCIFFWKKWKLMKDPRIGKKYDASVMSPKPYFDQGTLANKYVHPVLQ